MRLSKEELHRIIYKCCNMDKPGEVFYENKTVAEILEGNP